MTITEQRPVTKTAGTGEYPTLLRLGHKYEIALGQREPFIGLMGPLDLAFGPGELMRKRFDSVECLLQPGDQGLGLLKREVAVWEFHALVIPL